LGCKATTTTLCTSTSSFPGCMTSQLCSRCNTGSVLEAFTTKHSHRSCLTQTSQQLTELLMVPNPKSQKYWQAALIITHPSLFCDSKQIDALKKPGLIKNMLKLNKKPGDLLTYFEATCRVQSNEEGVSVLAGDYCLWLLPLPPLINIKIVTGIFRSSKNFMGIWAMQQMIENPAKVRLFITLGKHLQEDCEWWHHFIFLK